MPDSNLDVRKEWGSILVALDDKGGVETRWWFDVTEDNNLVFIQQVNDYNEAHPSTVEGRRYMAETEAYIPEYVRSKLHDRGFDTIVDTSGSPV